MSDSRSVQDYAIYLSPLDMALQQRWQDTRADARRLARRWDNSDLPPREPRHVRAPLTVLEGVVTETIDQVKDYPRQSALVPGSVVKSFWRFWLHWLYSSDLDAMAHMIECANDMITDEGHPEL